MKLLFLAPQPFFIERGTPIAVRLALEVLGNRSNSRTPLTIDLLTYHEGASVSLPSVNHNRINAPSWLKNIGPGASWKKLICDVIFLFEALKLVLKNRGSQYAMVHAVEESVFIALIIKAVFGIPYVYDMDSNLTGQLIEKWSWLKLLRPIFSAVERLAVRQSKAVVPVCESLAEVARFHGSENISVLQDISLLKFESGSKSQTIKEELSLPPNSELVVYIGNLESYQGIDLLLNGFAKLLPEHTTSHLIIIGGTGEHISKYKALSSAIGLTGRVHFMGPRPIGELDRYILQADILTSPRTKGENTPMKIYSYLHSGRAIVATKLKTHTQVLDDTVSVLAAPTPDEFASALLTLLKNPELRVKIGTQAQKLANEQFTFPAFSRKLNDTYDQLLTTLKEPIPKAA